MNQHGCRRIQVCPPYASGTTNRPLEQGLLCRHYTLNRTGVRKTLKQKKEVGDTVYSPNIAISSELLGP